MPRQSVLHASASSREGRCAVLGLGSSALHDARTLQSKTLIKDVHHAQPEGLYGCADWAAKVIGNAVNTTGRVV